MQQPMAGVRVLEVAMYGFVTSAGAVLADWGADVLKVEHPVTGDPQRGLVRTGTVEVDADVNIPIEHPNRGKRSIGLDIGSDSGRQVLDELIRQADVFLTSLLPSARQRFRIEVADVRAVNPNVIYARGSGLGTRGEEADKGGYDMTAFWCRGATAASLTPPDVDGMITPPAPAYGDTISGTNLAGGIAAALFARERSGEASVVDVSLLGSGVWAMGMAVNQSLLDHKPFQAPAIGTKASINPLVGVYRTSDDRYLTLVMLQAAKYWPDACAHLGHPEWADDPRFATHEALQANTDEASQLVRDAIATQTLAHWTEQFATLSGPWAPVQDSVQVSSDRQVRDNGYLRPVQTDDGREFELVANPVQFDEQPADLRRAPGFAEHTDQVLLEDLGYDWDKIIALKTEGTVT